MENLQTILENALKDKVSELRTIGAVNRATNFVLQTSSLAALVVGIASAPVLAAGTPLAIVGGLSYTLSIAAQSRRVGFVKPLPGLPFSLGQITSPIVNILSAMTGQQVVLMGAPPPPLTAYSFLDARQKREMMLAGYLSNQFVNFATTQTNDVEGIDHIFQTSVDHLMQLPDSTIINPVEALGPSAIISVVTLLEQNQSDWERRLQASHEKTAKQPQLILEAEIVENPIVATKAQSEAVTLVSRANPNEAPRQPAPAKPTALSLLTSSPFISRAIFGSQRTGKSYLAACASRQIAGNGTKIFHLNLASYGQEDEKYWQHATESLTIDLSDSPSHVANDAIGKAIALVEHFYSTENSVLIVDEWAYIGSQNNTHSEALAPLMNLLADKITTLSSTGIKRKKAIWTIAPECVGGSMTQDAKAVKKLSLVLVAIAPGKTVSWNNMPIGFSSELYSQINNNFTIKVPAINSALAGQDRIAFVDGEWVPVGVSGNTLAVDKTPAVAIAEPAQETDSDVVQVAVKQLKQHHILESLKESYKDEDVMLAFIDWIVKNQHQSIDYPSFKNANCFRKFGRSKEDWLRLVGNAFDAGLIIENDCGGYDMVGF